MMQALWLVFLLLAGATAAPAASSTTVSIHQRASAAGSNGSSLIDALKDRRVTHIVVAPNHLDLATELEGLPANFLLDRNVTVSGANGTNTVVDQQFQRARLQLCGSCTWTYRNITVANDNKGSAASNELFVAAELGARVILQDANVLRLACPSPSDTLGVLTITPRSSAFQDGLTQQKHSRRDIVVQGTSYPNALYAQSFSTDVAPSQAGRANTGGYALLWTNTGRPCKAYVPTSCLDSKSMDACTQDLTEQLLAEEQPSHGSSTMAPGVLAAAVAVPICVAVLAAAGVGFWCYQRRKHRAPKSPKTFSRRKRDLIHPDDLMSDTDTTPDVETGSGGPILDPDSGGPIRSDGQPMRRPLGLQAGWSVAKACTTPYLGPVDDDRIEFGELIGSGSFGRVYQAKWAGRDVAVKVIEHNTDTTVPVEREVTLMLSFNHPNIVRAYHFVTRVHTSEVLPHNPSRDNNELTKGSSTGSKGHGAAAAGGHGSGGGNGGHSSGHATATSSSTPSSGLTEAANMSLAAVAGNPHAAAAVAAAAAAKGSSAGGRGAGAAAGGVGGGGSGCNSSSGGSGGGRQQVIRTLPPLPHKGSSGGEIGGNTGGSANSRASAGGSSSDKPSTGGSVGNPQLQLVQRLPSLTGGTPRLVHKVETWLVQEYCDCGTLASVATEWKHEPESDSKMLERLQLLQDCAKGLKELHSRNVVHGDLNARNVLLSSSGVTNLGVVAKLADLGLSRIVRSHRSHHSTNTVGTMSHVAPELLRYGHMSTAGDIYAFGIMMWELYTGQAAFRKLHVGQFFEAIVVRNLRPIIPRGMAADYQLLMQSCWSASPNDRPSCDRLLNCLKLMIDVRNHRINNPAAAAAAGPSPLAGLSGSPRQLYVSSSSSHQQQQQHMLAQQKVPSHGSLAAAAGGPGSCAGFSAPLPALGAAAASDAALLFPPHSPKQQHHLHHHQATQQQARRQQQLHQRVTLTEEQLAGLQPQGLLSSAGAVAAGGGSPRLPVQHSAYSMSSGAEAAAAAALPGLLSMLKERAPQLNQQQLLQQMTGSGGRMHSSDPHDHRFAQRSSSGSAAAALIAEARMPRLTPINTGRRSSADSLTVLPQVGHSQSDPLPAHGAFTYSIQQQILMQLQQQQQSFTYTERSSESFHGFPEASAGSGGSMTGMPTPLLPNFRAAVAAAAAGGVIGIGSGSSSTGGGGGGPPSQTMVTPLTGVKYSYPTSSGGSGSAGQHNNNPAGGLPCSSTSASVPLPTLVGYSGGSGSSATGQQPRRLSGGPAPSGHSGTAAGSSSASGPLRLPGTSSLARSGSLGTSSRHWYWQRTAPAAFIDADEDDSKSVSDQEGPVDKLVDADQPDCPDVMAKMQHDLMYV